MEKEEKPKETSTEELTEEENERGFWGSPAEFVLSCLGYAVGLGNVWRFPYLCYTNGGGAFLIPYVIMLAFVGLPVFFLELCVGQFSGDGPATIWNDVAPLFKGIGIGMVCISFMGNLYYNMIIAWSLYYMFASFTSELPWDGCGHEFNTMYCYSHKDAVKCQADNGTWLNDLCYNQTEAERQNITYLVNVTKSKQVSSPEEYFNRYMLNRTNSIEDMGGLKWDICLTLLLAWIICFLCIIKGIRSSGKVVYFTATFPYLVLLIFFVRGLTLEGALEGIKFYIIPDWNKLLVPKVWGDAAGQIFFSLSVGGGGLMTFASYNKFHNNVFRDTLIVSIGNCATSVFAGFVIFSILGFMANDLGVEVKDVAKSGSGLAFIAYPEVFTRFPLPPLWSFLFFFMLLTLGLDSQFAGMENLVTAIVDSFPRLRRRKTWVALAMCCLLYLIGLLMCTRGGIYWLELISYYSGGWSLILVAMMECMVWAWVYGSKRLLNDIHQMLGFRPSMYWWLCWTIITPLMLIVILIFNFIEFTPLRYGGKDITMWAQLLGWGFAFISVIMVPIFAIIALVRSYRRDTSEKAFLSRLKTLSQPTDEWLPAHEKFKLRRLKAMRANQPQSATPDNAAYINPAYQGSKQDLS